MKRDILKVFFAVQVLFSVASLPSLAEEKDSEPVDLGKLSVQQSNVLKRLKALNETGRIFSEEKFSTLRKLMSSQSYLEYLRAEIQKAQSDLELEVNIFSCMSIPKHDSLSIDEFFQSHLVSPQECATLLQEWQKIMPYPSEKELKMLLQTYAELREIESYVSNVSASSEKQQQYQDAILPLMMTIIRYGGKAEDKVSFSKFMMEFMGAIVKLAAKSEKAEKQQILSILKNYGTVNGMLRLAILNPWATGRVLNRFEQPSQFTKWRTQAIAEEKVQRK